MKRGVLLFIVLFIIFVGVIIINSCKKGSGILAPGFVIPTPTPTFTPDINYSVYVHQQGTPVTGLRIQMINENKKIEAKTDVKGVAGFKVNEFGKWSLMIDTFDDFTAQTFMVEPKTNTYFAIDYGIPTLELKLISGSEQIPISPSSITYTVKYHTKFERKKYVILNLPEGIFKDISEPKTVSHDGDELTVRLDIKKSFEGYTRDKKYLDIYAYTQGIAPDQKTTTSNTRTLTKNWLLNATVDYYFFTLFAHDMDDGKTCYYAGIRNVDVSKSYNIPIYGTLKYEVKEFGTYSSANNTVVYSGLSNKCIPNFIKYTCCNFSYGCFNALAKIKSSCGDACAWKDYMGANGYIKVRIYDDGYLDVVRRFETKKGWSQIYYQWCCTS
ncbi:MAG: hypothetical protein N3E50_02340, partial [Candidatus Goldbacteria bacterium]|nr:hypothetical protein [Candidatus Goldiibacteriota bacterium]